MMSQQTVYRQPTCNLLYLNWNTFEPAARRRGILKSLVERAYFICSIGQLFER